MLRKTSVYILLVSLSLTFFAFIAHAQDSVQNTEITEETPTETTSDETLNVTGNKCVQPTDVLKEKLTLYAALKADHETKFQLLYIKAAGIATKADALGYNVTALNKDVDTLQNLIKNFTTAAENLLDSIESLQDYSVYACTPNEANYVTAVKDAKEALRDVRQSVRAIADFYSAELRTEILALNSIESEEQ